jgi:hypothetical protein
MFEGEKTEVRAIVYKEFLLRARRFGVHLSPSGRWAVRS